jgi:uncharacterized protein YcfJ
MKKLTTIIASLLFVSTSAFAGPVERPNVYDHYKTVVNQVPYNVEVCRQVTTQSGGASSGDVFVGAVIGGIIGNQVGKGRGNDAATILGAILGADHVNKNSQTHSTTGTHCSYETRYKETVSEVYSHSTITFMMDGKSYTVDFIK